MEVRDLAEWLSQRLDRLEDKVDQSQERGAQQAVRLDQLEADVAAVKKDLAPIRDHVAKLQGGWFLVTALAVVVGLGAGAARLLGH
jgi:chromosome segregation ATPase